MEVKKAEDVSKDLRFHFNSQQYQQILSCLPLGFSLQTICQFERNRKIAKLIKDQNQRQNTHKRHLNKVQEFPSTGDILIESPKKPGIWGSVINSKLFIKLQKQDDCKELIRKVERLAESEKDQGTQYQEEQELEDLITEFVQKSSNKKA